MATLREMTELTRTLLVVGALVFVGLLAMGRGDSRAQEVGPGVAMGADPGVESVTEIAISAGTRARGLLGVLAILGAAWVMSENRRGIAARTVVGGMVLQLVLGLLLFRWEGGRRGLDLAEAFVVGVLDCAVQGAAFVFGDQLTDPAGPVGFVFAFRVLPTIVFVAALFAVLYHLGVMQRVVGACAWVMARAMGSSGAESLNTAASLFLGQTEAPLTIRPYLPGLTRSELFVVMVSGMALVSGGVLGAYLGAGASARDLLAAIVLTAPAAIYLAKIVVPETGVPETLGRLRQEAASTDANVLDAAARGTREGMLLAVNVAAMLIAFLALIALLNKGLGWAGSLAGYEGFSLQKILGMVLAPVAWLIGVPWGDCPAVGGLLGTRAVTNELIAYQALGELRGVLQPRSYMLATIALCGFANLSSIGILLGGIGALVPERRGSWRRWGFGASWWRRWRTCFRRRSRGCCDERDALRPGDGGGGGDPACGGPGAAHGGDPGVGAGGVRGRAAGHDGDPLRGDSAFPGADGAGAWGTALDG